MVIRAKRSGLCTGAGSSFLLIHRPIEVLLLLSHFSRLAAAIQTLQPAVDPLLRQPLPIPELLQVDWAVIPELAEHRAQLLALGQWR